jgi:ribosomal protein S27E
LISFHRWYLCFSVPIQTYCPSVHTHSNTTTKRQQNTRPSAGVKQDQDFKIADISKTHEVLNTSGIYTELLECNLCSEVLCSRRDNVVCIANRYGLDGSWFQLWGGGSCFYVPCPDHPQEQPNLLYNGYRGTFLRIKRPGCGVTTHTPSRFEVKGRVDLYPYTSTPFRVMMECYRVKFSFTIFLLRS